MKYPLFILHDCVRCNRARTCITNYTMIMNALKLQPNRSRYAAQLNITIKLLLTHFALTRFS